LTFSVLLRLLAGAKILVFGDTHFDRGVRSAVRDGAISPLLASTQALRDSSDLVLFNLETPLCEASIPAVRKPISLRSDPATAPLLKKAGFTHAILANNHSMDRGVSGLARTIETLRGAGIQVVGASATGDPCAPVIARTKTDSVALLALVVLPGIDARHVCADTSAIHSRLVRLAGKNLPAIVSLHWGVEHSATVSRAQRDLARKLVDWGASALVGHHAHRVQTEVGQIPSTIDGRPVWYGIGNFLFDQHEPWTTRAVVAKLVLGKNARTDWSTVELERHGPWVKPRPWSGASTQNARASFAPVPVPSGPE